MLYLIVGAAFQGKRAYADRLYQQLTGCSEYPADDGTIMDLPDSLSWPIIDHLADRLRRLPADETLYQAAVIAWLDQLRQKTVQYPQQPQILILDEIGCGLVPMDAGDRLWRERCGRMGCRLAEMADRVDRIWCGLPVILKDNSCVVGLGRHDQP